MGKVWIMDRNEALRLLQGGKEGVQEWFRRRLANEEIPNLSGAHLRDAHLRDATLRGAYFRGANLIRAWHADCPHKTASFNLQTTV